LGFDSVEYARLFAAQISQHIRCAVWVRVSHPEKADLSYGANFDCNNGILGDEKRFIEYPEEVVHLIDQIAECVKALKVVLKTLPRIGGTVESGKMTNSEEPSVEQS